MRTILWYDYYIIIGFRLLYYDRLGYTILISELVIIMFVFD